MASTVNQIIARFQRRFRGVETSYAATLFDSAHKTVLKKCEVRNTTRAIALVEGVRQYDLSDRVYRIHEAYYEPSSDPATWTQLKETSLNKLTTLSGGWRSRANNATPLSYYITSIAEEDWAHGQIGFDPIPPITSSGSYPQVMLYVTEYSPITGDNPVPFNLLNDDVYLDLMSEQYCKENEHDKYPLYLAAAQRSLDANAQHVENLQSKGGDFEIVTPFRSGFSRLV